VDDYSPSVFKYTPCNDSLTMLKCDNGRCLDLSGLGGQLLTVANCSSNLTML
jgi:hypothetical protein